MSTNPTTRASLLIRLQDHRNHEAWAEFLEVYDPLILRVVRRFGLQDADAREVVQNLLISVSQRIGAWEYGSEKGTFRGFLRRTARNATISWMRSRDAHPDRRVGAVQSCDAEILDPLGDEGGDVFDLEFKRALIRKAVEKIREEFHAMTWKAFHETVILGLAPIGAAQALGMSIGAVRIAKCRVLARLRIVVRELESE